MSVSDWDIYIKARQAHHAIAKRFEYVKDIIRWSMHEHWETDEQIPKTGIIRGDCDAFALAARRELRAQGIHDARLIYCLTETNQAHLVCEIKGWILCNRQSHVARRDNLNYRWIKISGTQPGEPWRLITNG